MVILFRDLGLYLFLLHIVHKILYLCLHLNVVGVIMGIQRILLMGSWIDDVWWCSEVFGSLLEWCDCFFFVIKSNWCGFSSTSAVYIDVKDFISLLLWIGWGIFLTVFLLVEMGLSLNWSLVLGGMKFLGRDLIHGIVWVLEHMLQRCCGWWNFHFVDLNIECH